MQNHYNVETRHASSQMSCLVSLIEQRVSEIEQVQKMNGSIKWTAIIISHDYPKNNGQKLYLSKNKLVSLLVSIVPNVH